MLITFTKRFEFKDKSGRSIYPSGATLPVTESVAIAAALAGATDNPDARDLAKKTPKSSSNKALSKMTKSELIEEIDRLKSDSEFTALNQTITELQAKLEIANTEVETAETKVALSGVVDQANETAMQNLISAWNDAAPDKDAVETLDDITTILIKMRETENITDTDINTPNSETQPSQDNLVETDGNQQNLDDPAAAT